MLLLIITISKKIKFLFSNNLSKPLKLIYGNGSTVVISVAMNYISCSNKLCAMKFFLLLALT